MCAVRYLTYSDGGWKRQPLDMYSSCEQTILNKQSRQQQVMALKLSDGHKNCSSSPLILMIPVVLKARGRTCRRYFGFCYLGVGHIKHTYLLTWLVHACAVWAFGVVEYRYMHLCGCVCVCACVLV